MLYVWACLFLFNKYQEQRNKFLLLVWRDIGVCFLSIDLKLYICIAKDRHSFHIREACFTVSNGYESNIFLVHLFVHSILCLYLPYFLWTLPVRDKQIINWCRAMIWFSCAHIYVLWVYDIGYSCLFLHLSLEFYVWIKTSWLSIRNISYEFYFSLPQNVTKKY